VVLRQGMSGPEVLRVQQRLQELGFFSGTPRGNFGEMTGAAVRAFQAANGLAVDGVVGPNTWRGLFGEEEWQTQPSHDFGLLPPWLVEALKDLGKGVEEVAGPQNNPDIVEAFRHTSLGPQPDETPWCSAIMCAWMERAGIRSTRSAAAASWRDWGQELPDGGQRLGCVVVMSRPGGNHVALYLDEDDVGVYCLGGNQGDRVSVRRYPWERITNFRWPS
jgi:uncharacterized protein (TIGR02594 family)